MLKVKTMNKSLKTYLFLIWSVVLITSCSVNKYIPEDQVLYTGTNLKLNFDKRASDKNQLETELESTLYPTPNSKFLGMRLGLYYHYRAQGVKFGPITKFLNKKFGEQPVYLSDVDIARTEKLLDNRLENHGFFTNQVNSSIAAKDKKAEINYELLISAPYFLRNYQLDVDSSQLKEAIKNSLSQTILKPETRFDLNDFKQERSRIDDYLKSLGYYNFNGDFLIFEADTNQLEGRQFDLYLRLKKNTPLKSTLPYQINSIEVYPNFSLDMDSAHQDTTVVEDIAVIQSDEYFKAKLIPYYLLMKENTRYSPRGSEVTSQRYSSIGAYKYVNIRHVEANKVDSTDTTGLLDTKIYLSPMTRRSLRLQVQAVSKSNNFAGPSLRGIYSNRNLFHGGELLQLSGHIGYETQITGGKNTGLSSTQFGINGDLIFPRLIPIRMVDRFKYDVPKTKISLGIEYLNRAQLYQLRTLQTTYGYDWNASKYIYHQFNPISLNLVKLSNTTDEFETILTDNPFLASSFQQELIGGFTYSFTYAQSNNPKIRNPIYINSNLDVAGNLFNALTGVEENGKETIFGLEYAQYAKADLDLRINFDLGKSHQLVTRLYGGIGVAYGNSDAMPFAKQFYSGGPYSVRAFKIRSLGPGTYVPEDTEDNTSSFFDRTGDIRLEANTEYRFPIYSFLKGAIFLDVGNVWLRNGNEEVLPGGQFTSDFYKQLGIGTGAGLRIDIQNFVIRGDLAFPLDTPSGPFKPDPKSMIFNFAIGYPF
tara:strand:+ start:334 stop:2616 length:2283 start_codon:yes stop_codon:yes gene_type:complete